MRCAVYGCNVDNQDKNFDKSIRFFTFPKDKKVCQQWIHLCIRKDKFNKTSARVCSTHFEIDDYVRNLQHELLGYSPRNGRIRALKDKAVPSKNLPMPKKKENTSRNLRLEKRNRKQVVEEICKRWVPINM